MDHAPEHHAHSHGHAHGHTHSHAHGHDHHHGGGDYYLQQLLTVFICGAFGVAGLLMYMLPAGQGVTDEAGKPLSKLGVLLSPGFHVWVLVGSVVLLAITVIRGIALWQSAGANQHHHHGHDHGHDHHHHDHKGEKCDHPSHAQDHHHHHEHKPGEKCDHPSHKHDHAHHGHDHDHGDHSADDHSHGNIYWRVVVLLFPVVILVMGLPNGTFSAEYQAKRVKGNEVGDLADVADTGTMGDVGFEALASAAYSQQSRDTYTGKTVTVYGQFKPLSDTQFTLFFFKMTCCAADQVPLKATCVVKSRTELEEVVTENGQKSQRMFQNGQKMTVTGKLQFTQEPSTGEWLTVIRVDRGGVKKK
jgi:hypothetical protein